MPLPTFLVIGAAKSGTTSLYYYLSQHPDVFMSRIKEPHFFAYEGQQFSFNGPGDMDTMQTMVVTEYNTYASLFDGARPGQARGEASAMYIAEDGVAQRILDRAPDMKLIAILRQPAARAFSSYQHMRRDGHEPEADFEVALRLEPERIRAHWHPIWHYKRLGFYSQFLKPFWDRFPPDQFRIYLFDDLIQQPANLMRDMFEFVGVNPNFTPSTGKRYNESGAPKSMWLHRYLGTSTPLKRTVKRFIPASTRENIVRGMLSRNLRPVGSIDPRVCASLTEEYRDDILELQDRIGRDLSHWLAV